MRFATFMEGPERFVGSVSQDGRSINKLNLSSDVAHHGVLSLIEMVARGEPLLSMAQDSLPIEAIALLAPIPRPRRNIFCVGRNYHAHAKELSGTVFKANAADPAAWPIVFTKVPESVVGPMDHVFLPVGVSSQIDYEAELAVIIGKTGKNISRDDALSHVYGYTIVNDVTARDVQMRHQQWDLGKSFDTFCPMGP